MLKKFISLTLSTLLVLTACLTAPVIASAEGPLRLTQKFESKFTVSDCEIVSDFGYNSNGSLHFINTKQNQWAKLYYGTGFGGDATGKYIQAGKTYTVNFQIFIKTLQSKGNAVVALQYLTTNNSGWNSNTNVTINKAQGAIGENATYYILQTAKTGEWFTVTRSFTADRDAYLGLYFYNSDADASYADVYVDDVVLEEQVQTTVTFNSNGGTDCAAITAMSGAALTLPTPTKEGCDFLGWYEDEALTKGYTSAYQPENDITLYAKWDVIGDGVWEQDFESYSLTSFANSNNNKRVQSETAYAGNYALQRFVVTNASGDPQPNSFVPLFPRSTEKIHVGKKYTLTFKYKSSTSDTFRLFLVTARTAETNQGTDAGTVNVSAVNDWTTVTKTIDLTDSSKFTADNYLCLYSWNRTEYFLDDIRLAEYAPVTVSYVTNSDDVIDSMTDYPGAALTLPTPTTKVLGKAFAGWYTDAALTQPYTAAVYPAENTTLYAKWTNPGWVQDFETYSDAYNTDYSNVITSGITEHDLITVADREADYVTSGKRSIRYAYDSAVDGGTSSGTSRIVINACGDRKGLSDYLTKKGDVLKVSFKYKTTNGAPKLTVYTGYDDFTNAWAATDKSGIAGNASTLSGASGEWQTFTKSFVVNPVESLSRVKTLVFFLSGAGEVYIDDVEALVVPTGVETAYNGVAAIRAANETANVKQGFRLYNRVNKQWLEDYNIVEFGALAIRKGRLAEGAALNVSTENVAKGVAWQKDGNQSLWEDLGDSYSFTAVLIGIREKFYAEDYSVVTYAKDASGNYIYGEVQDLCVYNVVESILASSSATEADRSTANAVIAQAAAAAAEDDSVVTYEAWKNAQAGQTA